MSVRMVILIVAAAYFVFSIVYLVFYGFEDPRSAMWIGLVGIIVMAVGMGIHARSRKK